MGGGGAAIGRVMTADMTVRVVVAATRRRLLDRLGAALLALAVLGFALYGWVRPDYNWDMVAYVATALENRHADAESLHRETWAVIGEGASEAQLFHLQQSNPYNLHQWQNPADFQSQLGMYRVKLAYTALLRALEPVAGLADAAILLSVLPALGLGALLLVWLREAGAFQAAFLLVPALMLADLPHMVTAATPDMLVAFVSALALYMLWRGRDVPAALLLFLSVLVRPDNVILVFALLIAAVLFGWRKLPLVLAFAASLAAGVVVGKLGDHPGWWAHFVFSCVEIQHSMANFHPDFSLAAFLKGYVRGAVVAVMDNDWPALLLALTGGWALLARAGLMRNARANGILFALGIGTLGKFASFPLPDDRFYFAFLAGFATVLLVTWRPRFDLDDLLARPAVAADRDARRASDEVFAS